MKSLLLAIFSFTVIHARSQKLTVKLTNYNPEGKILSESVKVIAKPENSGSLYFFKKEFNLPKEIPEKLVDPEHKGKMIVSWHNEKEEKNLTTNWNNTFTYDSLSRLIAYTYSGCVMCSSIAYKYTIQYNNKGLVETIKNSVNGNDMFKIIYNDRDQVVQIDYFVNNKLSQSLLTDL
jgi:hypothetical protein